MVGSEMLLEELLETRGTGLASFAFLIVRARLLVEMSRTGDVRVLQGIRPTTYLPGAALGQ
jgi:hypothetical protein